MTDQTLPEPFVAYLVQRQNERAEVVADIWNSLTEREQGLVHDAAVMGYVQGMRHPEGERIGKDRQTIALVLDACLAFPDLYPTVAAARQAGGQQPDTAPVARPASGLDTAPAPTRCPDWPECNHPFMLDGCTCRPWTRQTTPARYLEPGDSIEMISGWERGADCPHHAPAAGPDDTQTAEPPADTAAAIEMWARLLHDAGVHALGDSRTTWAQLTPDAKAQYRKAAAWLMGRVIVPPEVIRAKHYRDAADEAEKLRQFEKTTGARAAAQISENVGILRVADHFRRLADEGTSR